MLRKKQRIMAFIDGSNVYHRLIDLGLPTSLNYNLVVKKLCPNDNIVDIHHFNAAPRWEAFKDPEKFKQQQRYNSYLEKSGIKTHWGRLQQNKSQKAYKASMRLVKSRKFCSACYQRIKAFFKDYFKSQFKEKKVDVMLASEMIDQAVDDNYDVALLMTNDGDYTPAIKKVQKRGKQVTAAYFPINYANELIKTCNDKICINQSMLSDCYIKFPKKQPKQFTTRVKLQVNLQQNPPQLILLRMGNKNFYRGIKNGI